MGREIERKFLVDPSWRPTGRAVRVRQGYLSMDPKRVVRVRAAGRSGFITIKGKGRGISRPEFEYRIPLRDAEQLLRLCTGSIVSKRRYKVRHAGRVWEIDRFEGANRGLVIAEIELSHARESFEKPAWVGKEVSDDDRYVNARLASEPFSEWGGQGRQKTRRSR
jgi:adenylate cyclase